MTPYLLLVGSWVVVLAIFLHHKRRDKLMHLRADVQTRMLDRLSSSPELIAFLNTPDGRHLLEAITTDPVDPRHRVVRGVSIGVAALIIAGSVFGMVAFADNPGKRNDFMILGMAISGVALAFLVAAVVSYSLTRAFGLDKR